MDMFTAEIRTSDAAQALVRRWIKALRGGIKRLAGGEYEQGEGRLRTEQGTYCCLGVVCDLYDPTGWVRIEDDGPDDGLPPDSWWAYSNTGRTGPLSDYPTTVTGTLPDQVMKALCFSSPGGDFPGRDALGHGPATLLWAERHRPRLQGDRRYDRAGVGEGADPHRN